MARYFCCNVDLKSPLFVSHSGVIFAFEGINLRSVDVFFSNMDNQEGTGRCLEGSFGPKYIKKLQLNKI